MCVEHCVGSGVHCEDWLVEVHVHRIRWQFTCIFYRLNSETQPKAIRFGNPKDSGWSMCTGYKYMQFAVVCLANQVMSESMCSRPLCQDACSDSCHTISPQCSTEKFLQCWEDKCF